MLSLLNRLFFFSFAECCFLLLAEEGLESREGAKAARRGRMQHQGEGGEGGEERKEEMRLTSQSPEKERRQKEQGGDFGGSGTGRKVWGEGFLVRRQAGGGATFKRKHINREFEFQSSSKMMSVSQKISFHHNNQLKTAKKKKRVAGVCVLVSISFQSCCCICGVLCERFVRCNPHLA